MKRNGDTSSVGMLPINKSGARNYHSIAKTLSRDRVEKIFGQVDTGEYEEGQECQHALPDEGPHVKQMYIPQ